MASLKYWLWLTGRKLSGPLKLALDRKSVV